MFPQSRLSCLRRLGRQEKGATAIEFALVFPLFLAIFIGMVTFGMIFVLQQAMTFAVEEGARAALSVDPAAYSNPNGSLNQASFQAAVTTLAKQRITNALLWLPGTLEDKAVPDVALQAIPTGGTAVVVTVRYPYRANPIIPIIPLPFVGELVVPEQLIAQAIARVI